MSTCPSCGQTKPRRRPQRRGDNIPPVSDYAHWNEDAEAVWFLENRYDMEHADELLDDPEDYWEDEDEDEE